MSKPVRKIAYALRLPNGDFRMIDKATAKSTLQNAVVIRRGRSLTGCRIFALDIGGSLRIDWLTDSQIAANR